VEDKRARDTIASQNSTAARHGVVRSQKDW
jgi:hypothetical protein